MNKPSNKILLLIIAVLLLTNIGVLVYFLGFRQECNAAEVKKGATELLKEQVGFSPEQLAQYVKLRDQQRETIRPMYERMRAVKDSLYSLVSDSTVTEDRLDAIADRIGERQQSLDVLTFHHFSELRKICRPDQRVAYDSMIVQLFRKPAKLQKPKADDKK